MKSVEIIHLSDLHLSKRTEYDTKGILSSLVRDIRSKTHRTISHSRFIVLSGDLTYSGKENEFALVRRFIEDLEREVKPTRIIFCPGNHDVYWPNHSKTNAMEMRELVNRKRGAVRRIEKRFKAMKSERHPLRKHLTNYYSFLRGYSYSNVGTDGPQYPLLYYVETFRVEKFKFNFISLNSAFLFDKKFPYYGYIGKTQITRATDKALDLSDYPSGFKTFNVTIFHHPFQAIAEPSQVETEELVKNRSDLILNGHVHSLKAYVDVTRRISARDEEFSCPIISCARCVYDEHGEVDITPGYSIVTVELDGDIVRDIEIFLTDYDWKTRKWIPASGKQPSRVSELFRMQKGGIVGSTLMNSLETGTEALLTKYGKNKLFASIVENVLSKTEDQLDSNGIVCSGEHLVRDKGKLVFENLTKGGFATFNVELKSWDTATDYFETLRTATKKRKLDVKRVFLCDNATRFHAPMWQHLSEDLEAGIQVLVLKKENVHEEDRSELLQDFGIWDDKVVCIVENSGEGLACKFTPDALVLKRYVGIKQRLLEMARYPESFLEREAERLPRDLREVLATAPEMAKLAEKYCRTNFYLPDGPCVWYHSAWQYLRVLEMVSTPEWHKDFYMSSLSKVFGRIPAPRVLICGLADYAMLGIVAEAWPDDRHDSGRIVVLDLCRTPLESSKEYAKRNRLFNVEFVQEDILKTQFRKGEFDLIVTDAFLTRLDNQARKKVVGEWERLLNPGGVIITTARLGTSSEVASSTEQAENFARRAVEKAATRGLAVYTTTAGTQYLLAHDKLRKLAERYAHHMKSQPVSEDEITRLFSNFNLQTSKALTQGEIEQPTSYVRIFATKPG